MTKVTLLKYLLLMVTLNLINQRWSLSCRDERNVGSEWRNVATSHDVNVILHTS